MPPLRDWTPGATWPQGQHLQQPVDALRAIGADGAYNPQGFDVAEGPSFIGTVTDKGPNGEANYKDERYYIRRSFIDAGQPTDAVIFKDDDLDPLKIYTVTNRPEIPTHSHSLKVGQPVRAHGWLDHSNPRQLRWFMSEPVLQLGTFQLTSRIINGLYNGRSVKGAPTALNTFIGLGPASFPQTGETVSATDDVLVEYMPDVYTGALPPPLGTSGGAFVQGFYTGSMSVETTPRPIVRAYALAATFLTTLVKYVGSSSRSGLVLVNECAPIAFPFTVTGGAGISLADIGTDGGLVWLSAAYAIDLTQRNGGPVLGAGDLGHVFTGRFAGQWQISAGPPATYGSVYTIEP